MKSREEIEEFFVKSFDAAREWYPQAPLVKRHSEVLAEALEKVARKMQENGVKTVDPEMAYICGLIHDIGKSQKDFYGLNHPILGYKILKKLGLEEPARVAMTHTYYGYREIDRQEFWDSFENAEDLQFTREYMDKVEMNDLDKLVQLVDNMAHQIGVMTISDRFSDILIRHNIQDASAHLKELYRLKMYFDEKCGMNIYKIFENDIIRTALMEPNDSEARELSLRKERVGNEI